jgi:hypothetical protein
MGDGGGGGVWLGQKKIYSLVHIRRIPKIKNKKFGISFLKFLLFLHQNLTISQKVTHLFSPDERFCQGLAFKVA